MEKLLERITSVIAAMSALIVALSVSHEFGYFSYIGRFFQAFVTASDYFTNAILWMPVAIITIVGWQNWKFLWLDPPRATFNNWTSWILPTLLLGVPILLFLFVSEGGAYGYLAALVYLWFLFFDRFAPGAGLASEVSIELRSLVKIGFPVCAALFTLGYEHARSDLNVRANREPYLIRLKDQPLVSLRIPLRNFDKGVLLSDPTNHRIEFTKWDKIDSISKPLDTSAKAPLSCPLFGILCGANGAIP